MSITCLVRMKLDSSYGLKRGQLRVANIEQANDTRVSIRYGNGRWDWTCYSREVCTYIRELPNTAFYAPRNKPKAKQE